ncbi:ABC transporter substrate-binding protein [Ihubacter sp. mB4P-1]|uniref:ABC transporter substrate-binding protein n=1 Tax=Ihubacter sp. mB4P-1 TaxID=3242370 RepID=UPI00137B5276
MRKKLLVLGLIVAFVFSMTACGGGGEEESAKKDLTIIDSEWYGLDTYQLDSTAGGQGLNSTGLFQWDAEKGDVVDNVCTNWQVSEDGKTATFDVPEGMKYSTGEQVEPEDVIASLEHGLEVSPYSDGYSNIESMEYEGRTVTLHLSEFRSDMLYYLCAGFAIVIDKDELDKMSNEELMWGCHPYGMYALAEDGYVSGSEVNLVRNDGFKCENPLVENKGAGKFETVKVRFNVEDFTQTEDLKAGNVDMLMSLSSDQYLELQNDESVTLADTTYPNITYFEMNTDSEVFSDINVRKALALAIDRDGMAEVVDGLIGPAYSMIYDTVQNFSQEAKDYFEKNLANDPEKAKQLLEEAGWKEGKDGIREKDGKKLEFTWYAWTDSTTIPEAMAEQLKQVGFKMNIEAIDWNYVYENISADKYDAGIEWLSWAEPMLVLNACYYDKNAPGNTKEYKKMVEKAAHEADGEARTKMVGDIQMHLFENVNMIPMYAELSFTAMNKDLKGFKVLADGSAPLNDLAY